MLPSGYLIVSFLVHIVTACGSKVTVDDRKMSKHDFPAMKNDLILRAARGEAVEKAPVSSNSYAIKRRFMGQPI